MFTPRISWDDLPDTVRDAVERTLGGAVIEHLPQTGGFSPGAAERLLLSDGTRAFCKAVHPSQNEGSARLYRAEARVNAQLPDGIPAPRMLHHLQLDGWEVLLFEDVDGVQPSLPWRESEFVAALDAFGALADADTAGVNLPPASEVIGDDYRGFDRLLADPAPDLDPWLAARLPALAARAAEALERADGTTLCSVDARADNLLVRDGAVVILDWPWGSLGSRWLDAAQLTNSGLSQGATFDPVAVTDAWIAARGGTPRDLNDGLIGALAFYADAVRHPPMPGLEALSAFRVRALGALLPVMRERLEDEGLTG